MLDTNGLVKKLDCNTKISDIENKMSSISGLATTSVLTAVENKIPNVSSLVKKKDYNAKVNEIEKKLTDHNRDKYITTPEFNKFTAEVFDARLARAILITKTYFDAKSIKLNRKITSKKTKHLRVENELKKLKTFDSIFFRSKSHLEEDIHKIIKHLIQFTDILKGFLVLVEVIIYIFGNLKDCLMQNRTYCYT